MADGGSFGVRAELGKVPESEHADLVREGGALVLREVMEMEGARPPMEPDREGGLAPSAPANHRDEPEPKDHGDAQTRAARSDNLRSARSAEIRKESDGGRPGHTAERVPHREAPPTHAARPR